MLELVFFFLLIIGFCDLVLALAPPVGMASKDFHRVVRSETRQDVDTLELHAAIFADHLAKLRLREILDKMQLIALHNRARGFIAEIDMVDSTLIDEDTVKSLAKIKARLVMRDDMLVARYLEITDLNRSEARKFEKSA